MKRIIRFICMTVMLLSMSLTAFAGDIPEGLLSNDKAQIFFAEVVAYHPDKESPDIEFSPTKKIKGDVKLGTKQIAYNPSTVGGFKVKVGKVYLFTYFDEHNPTNIFEVTSYDTSTLKLKNTNGDMWERFEKYINEGRYEDAEHARLDKQNEGLPIGDEDVSLVELLGVEKEDAETVSIHYNGEIHEIDVNAFYTAIEDIVLTDIEDVSLEKQNGDTVSFPNGMYIMVNGFDGYAFITDDCKVDRYGRHYSSIPVGAYTMKFVDRAKITALFAADEYKSLPLETPLVGRIVRLSVLIVFFAAFVIGFAIRKKQNRNTER